MGRPARPAQRVARRPSRGGRFSSRRAGSTIGLRRPAAPGYVEGISPSDLNRFNGPGRGAWYAALAQETAIAEVEFVDLRGLAPAPACLDPDPARGYVAGNAVAAAARAAGYNGIVYPSARHLGGTCLVALTPHAVQSVAQGDVLRLVWTGGHEPEAGPATV